MTPGAVLFKTIKTWLCSEYYYMYMCVPSFSTLFVFYFAHVTMRHHCLTSYITGKARNEMTTYQKKMSMKIFQAKPYLEWDERHQLAKLLNVSGEMILKWYEKKCYGLDQRNCLLKLVRNV